MRDYLPKGGMWGWSSVYKVEVGMPWYGRNCILGEYCTWFIWIFGFLGLFCPLGLWLWCYIIPTMVIYCRSEGSEQLFIELGEGLDIEITIMNAVCVPTCVTSSTFPLLFGFFTVLYFFFFSTLELHQKCHEFHERCKSMKVMCLLMKLIHLVCGPSIWWISTMLLFPFAFFIILFLWLCRSMNIVTMNHYNGHLLTFCVC